MKELLPIGAVLVWMIFVISFLVTVGAGVFSDGGKETEEKEDE